MNKLEQKTYALWSAVGVSERSSKIMQEKLQPLKDLLPEMYAHSLRVGLYCGALTTTKTNESRRLAVMGGCMHDIGKAQFSPEYFRNGPLTPGEFEELKRHPLIGFEQLKNHLPMTALVVGLHHAVGRDAYGVQSDAYPFVLPPHHQVMLTERACIVAMVDFCDSWRSRRDAQFGADRGDIALAWALGKKFDLPEAQASQFVDAFANASKQYF